MPTTPDLLTELREQPGALRALAQFYTSGEGAGLLRLERPRLAVFTGMGASYHAARIAAAHAAALGLPALALEAIDLLNYQAAGLLQPGAALVYISQSGKSAEVEGVLAQAAGRAPVIALTNHPGSPLGLGAAACLPLLAEQRIRLASKNYVNSLALLWLLVRRWADVPPGAGPLLAAADRMESLLARAAETSAALLAAFAEASPLVFLGHGPHAATARQSALMLSEWARANALDYGIGAFRHGFVETVRPGMGALVFAPPGRAEASAMALARQLESFGVQVVRVAFGALRELAQEVPPDPLDEFISPLLDVVPMQLFAGALAVHRGVTADFRYIEATRGL